MRGGKIILIVSMKLYAHRKTLENIDIISKSVGIQQ